MDYDVLVFIGRFSPFTSAHFHVVQEALKRSKELIILVGSADAGRSLRTPWIYSERRAMISRVIDLSTIDSSRVTVLPVLDFEYDDNAWITHVNKIVGAATLPSQKIGLIGHSKDATSFYLKLFPNWGAVNVPNFKEINATDVRNIYFNLDPKKPFETIGQVVPPAVYGYLMDWRKSVASTEMQDEFDFCKVYKEKWGEGPFFTNDAVCLQAGHILLIKRGDMPGKGKWALPGGFMEKGETALEGAVRELIEETSIDVPPGVLRGSASKSTLFDAPNRDPRARILTMAHLFDLNHELERRPIKRNADGSVSPLSLSKIKAASDAKHVEWVPLNKVERNSMFADHYHIIQKIIGEAK